MCAFRYEEQLKEAKLQKEDLSDMVAEHAAKQKVREERERGRWRESL